MTSSSDNIVDQTTSNRSRRKNGEGTIITRMQKCGKASCHCMKGGSLHGPYTYRVVSIGGKRIWKKIN